MEPYSIHSQSNHSDSLMPKAEDCNSEPMRKMPKNNDLCIKITKNATSSVYSNLTDNQQNKLMNTLLDNKVTNNSINIQGADESLVSLSSKYDMLEAMKSVNDKLKGKFETERIELQNENQKKKRLLEEVKGVGHINNQHKLQIEKLRKQMEKEREKIRQKELNIQHETVALNQQYTQLNEEIEKKLLEKETLKEKCFKILKMQQDELEKITVTVKSVKERKFELVSFFNYLSSKKVKNQAEIDMVKLEVMFEKILNYENQENDKKVKEQPVNPKGKRRKTVSQIIVDTTPKAEENDKKIDQDDVFFKNEAQNEYHLHYKTYQGQKISQKDNIFVPKKFVKPTKLEIEDDLEGFRRNISSKTLFIDKTIDKFRKSYERLGQKRMPLMMRHFKSSPKRKISNQPTTSLTNEKTYNKNLDHYYIPKVTIKNILKKIDEKEGVKTSMVHDTDKQ